MGEKAADAETDTGSGSLEFEVIVTARNWVRLNLEWPGSSGISIVMDPAHARGMAALILDAVRVAEERTPEDGNGR